MKALPARSTLGLVLAVAIFLTPCSASAVDVDAAKALARQNNCFKCHGVDKEKDGPAYKAVAEKYRGKDNAQTRLVEHLSTGEKAKYPDGHEEEHKIVQTSPPKDMNQIKNLVDWILSL
jgi:cytochrome c